MEAQNVADTGDCIDQLLKELGLQCPVQPIFVPATFRGPGKNKESVDPIMDLLVFYGFPGGLSQSH